MKRVALVTGGGRGIGREICRVLAAAGHAVAAADIDEASARDTAASLPGEGHLGLHVDVAGEASVEAMFERVEKALGPVAVLVCNAGRLLLHDGRRPLVTETSLDNWQDTFAVNTVG
ncbi:SDR family NAD(P)-dependent oxidoreductase, partial [Acinetobacter baumannii]|uniref:SDR family NAD(P)-dependent oxidoreductase n=2 Tax=Gammaproteobacteria TaxID=1236 RepID=UPI00148EA5BE